MTYLLVWITRKVTTNKTPGIGMKGMHVPGTLFVCLPYSVFFIQNQESRDRTNHLKYNCLAGKRMLYLERGKP